MTILKCGTSFISVDTFTTKESYNINITKNVIFNKYCNNLSLMMADLIGESLCPTLRLLASDQVKVVMLCQRHR